jgi:hypothetical protein
MSNVDPGFQTSFAHLSEYGLKVDQFADFKEAATRIAGAYNKAVGIPWAAYSTYAGPYSNVYVLIPLHALDQLDEIPSVDEVLVNEYGEEGKVFLRDYQRAVTRVSTSIITNLPLLAGREVAWGPEMPTYLYYSKYAIGAGESDRFQKAAEKIAIAQREREDGLPWFAYSTLAGEPLIHCLVPLHKLGELSLVHATTRTVLDVYGPEDGSTILAEFQRSIAESRSSVLQYLGHYSR